MGLLVMKLAGYWAFKASEFNAISVMIPQRMLGISLARSRFSSVNYKFGEGDERYNR